MARLEYDDPDAEKQFNENDVKQRDLAGSVPLPKARPEAANAAWTNSPEGKLDGELRALQKPERSWLGKSIYGK